MFRDKVLAGKEYLDQHRGEDSHHEPPALFCHVRLVTLMLEFGSDSKCNIVPGVAKEISCVNDPYHSTNFHNRFWIRIGAPFQDSRPTASGHWSS